MHKQPNTEPIRKPRFRMKFAVQRHRQLARILHSRFALFDGRIILVADKPCFNDLRTQLLEVENWTHCDREKFLRKFRCDGELSIQQVQRINASLEHWSRGLEKCNRKSQLFHDRVEQLAEIELLRQRLDFAAKTLRDPSKVETNFLLDPVQQAEVVQVLQMYGVFLSSLDCPQTLRLAHLVFWLGGKTSLERFIGTLLNTHESSHQVLGRIGPLVNWLRVLQRRVPHEEHWIIAHELKQNSSFNEFVQIATLKDVWKPVKRCKLAERLERYQENLSTIRDWAVWKQEIDFPATVAAWAVATQGGNELPRRVAQLVRDSNVHEKFIAQIEYLVGVSGSAGYGQVVELLNSNDVCLSNKLIEKVGQWLHLGYSMESVLFCVKNLKLVAIGPGVSPSLLRRSAERFQRLFGDSGCAWFIEVHGHIHSDGQVEVIDTVFRWMEKFSNFKLLPKMNDTIMPALKHLKKLLKLKRTADDLVDQVHAWYGKAAAVAECFPDESTYPKQLRTWLRRLGYYQRLSSQECILPKFLRQNLMADKKRQKELSYLRTVVDSGEATSKLRQRFDYLSNLQVDDAKDERKNIREVQEACLLAGLGMLRRMVIQEAASIWTKTSQQPLHRTWSDNRTVEMGQWANRMTPQEQKFLRQILTSHAEHGAKYKSHIPFNQPWIREMAGKGFAIEHWLDSARKLTKIGERDVTISFSHDPYEVFMMGNYFGSCLSQGGCNEMSVLSNAADANKHVVYVHDADGTVLARQLITINRKNELLRYCLYVATKEISGADCKLIYRTEVDQFCREVAMQVGLKLGEHGAPASLANQFWYDDVAEKWHDEEQDKSDETEDAEETPISVLSQLETQGHLIVQPNHEQTNVICVQANFGTEWFDEDRFGVNTAWVSRKGFDHSTISDPLPT